MGGQTQDGVDGLVDRRFHEPAGVHHDGLRACRVVGDHRVRPPGRHGANERAVVGVALAEPEEQAQRALEDAEDDGDDEGAEEAVEHGPAGVHGLQTVLVIERNGRLLLRQRPPDAVKLAGFWELPQIAEVPAATNVAIATIGMVNVLTLQTGRGAAGKLFSVLQVSLPAIALFVLCAWLAREVVTLPADER